MRVVATWNEGNALEDEILRFQAAATLGPPAWRGLIAEVRPAKKETWSAKRLLMTVLPAVVGVLGGLEALRHHHAWLLASADFDVVKPKKDFDLLAGTTAQMKWEVRNVTSGGVEQVKTMEATLIGPAGAAGVPKPIELDANATNWSKELAAGEVLVAAADLPPLPAGHYELLVKHVGKAGRLRFNLEKEARLPVRSWRTWEFVPQEPEPAEGSCRLWFDLRIGSAFTSGAKLEARMAAPRGTRIEVLDVARLAGVKAEAPVAIEGQTRTISRQIATLPALEAFKSYRVWIGVSGAARPIEQWRELARELSENNLKIESL